MAVLVQGAGIGKYLGSAKEGIEGVVSFVSGIKKLLGKPTEFVEKQGLTNNVQEGILQYLVVNSFQLEELSKAISNLNLIMNKLETHESKSDSWQNFLLGGIMLSLALNCLVVIFFNVRNKHQHLSQQAQNQNQNVNINAD